MRGRGASTPEAVVEATDRGDAGKVAPLSRQEPEDLFRLVMTNAPVGMALVANDRTFISVNPAMCQMLDRDEETLLTMTWADLTHPDDLEPGLELTQALQAGARESFRQRKRYLRRDGSILWGDLSVSCVRHADRTVAYSISQIVDVTAQVAAHDELLESEARFRLLAENASDVVFRSSNEAAIEWIAPTVTHVLGWLPEELVGHSLDELLHPEDVERVRLAHAEPDRQQTVYYEARLPTVTGAWHWMAVSARPLLNDSGVVIGRIGAMRDAGEAVAAREALEMSERHYRMLAENASDVVYERDLLGTVVWVSPSVEAELGWRPDEIVGQRITDFVHPDDIVEILKSRARLLAGEVDTKIAIRFRASTGSYIHMSTVSHPVRDAFGSITGGVVGLRDIDDLMQVQDELTAALATAARRGEHLQAILDAQLDPNVALAPLTDDGGAIVDLRFIDANAPAAEYLGLEREQLIGSTLLQARPAISNHELLAKCIEVIRTGETLTLTDFVYAVDDTKGERHFDLRAVRLGDGLTVTWRDVTEGNLAAKALAESEESHRLLAENAGDVIVRSRAGRMLWVSPSITTALGWAPSAWIDHDFGTFIHAEDSELVTLAHTDVRGLGMEVERVRVRAADAQYHWIETHSHAFLDASGREDGTLTTFRVIDEEVAAQDALDYQARHDELTGLLNRKEVLGHVADTIIEPRRTGDATAVLFCDIDRFKNVNDTYGHRVGDLVLQEISARIRGCVRAEDTVARFGGDELLVVLRRVHDLVDATHVAEAVRAAVAEPIAIDDGHVTATMSIGVTIAVPGDTVDGIVARADDAMYTAKIKGRNQVVPITS